MAPLLTGTSRTSIKKTNTTSITTIHVKITAANPRNLAIIVSNLPIDLERIRYIDPFSILVRGLTLAVYPAFNALNTTFFTFTYQHAPAWVNTITESVYSLLKQTVLPFDQKYYDLAFLSLFILLAVFLLERFERRFFCRNICPLGAMLAVTSRFSILKGIGGGKCGKCRNCQDICRMGAIDENRNISSADCNLCLDCVEYCPGKKISFQFPTYGHKCKKDPGRASDSKSHRSPLMTPVGQYSRPVARS